MALIRCKLCDNKLSTRALTCPKCGCPNIARSDAQPRKVRNCVECEHYAGDSGFTCNLCDVDMPRDRNGAEAVASGTDGDGAEQRRQWADERIDVGLIAAIEKLDVDDHLKNLFMKFSLATSISHRFGIPVFDCPDDSMRHFTGVNSVGTVDSNLALVLGPLYYFAVGLWKKGAVLLIAVLLLSLGTVFWSPAVSALLALAVLYLYLLCYCNAKYDRYRQLILDEHFWW